jgi:type I restriction enzyme R subunit
MRAYAAIANELTDAGYSATDAAKIKAEVRHYEQVRQEVKLGAGENIDYRAYEADMRYLLDTYIRADESEVVTTFDDKSLVQLIGEYGLDAAVGKLPAGIKNSPEAVAETIENNTRKLITDEQPINPKYYDKMSELLDALIEQRRANALEYKQYLEALADLATKILKPETGASYPANLTTQAQRALFDNLDANEELALKVDTAIRTTRKDSWRGSTMKEREMRNTIRRAVGSAEASIDLDALFDLVKHQDEY